MSVMDGLTDVLAPEKAVRSSRWGLIGESTAEWLIADLT
jgi:hypothetical protein